MASDLREGTAVRVGYGPRKGAGEVEGKGKVRVREMRQTKRRNKAQ